MTRSVEAARANDPLPQAGAGDRAGPGPAPLRRLRGAAGPGAAADPGRFEVRRQRVGAAAWADERLRRAAFALTTFDAATDPDAVRSRGGDGPGCAEALVAVNEYLVHRVLQRAAYGRQGRPFEPAPVTARLRPGIELVERCFRRALLDAFPPASGVFPVRAFEHAFAAFVGGELRAGHPWSAPGLELLPTDGVPDGANFFCFAEAVLLFGKLGIEWRFWAPRLRMFVGGAQVFAATYWHRGSRAWNAYGCEHQRHVVPAAVTLAAIDQFDAALDASRLAARFTGIVAVALRDEPALPVPAPVAKEFA